MLGPVYLRAIVQILWRAVLLRAAMSIVLWFSFAAAAAAAGAGWVLWSEYRDGALIDPNHPIGVFETLQLCEGAIDRQAAALRAVALGEVGTIFHRLGGNPSSTTFILSRQSGPVARWDVMCLPDTVDRAR